MDQTHGSISLQFYSLILYVHTEYIYTIENFCKGEFTFTKDEQCGLKIIK